MRPIWFAGSLALLSLACNREKEGADPASSSEKESAKAKSSKITQRSETKKPIPMAEPAPDQPGFVKSPYSGAIIDVTREPAGTLIADPNYPEEEGKKFRVPEMPATEEQIFPPPDIEVAKGEARPGKTIPDKPGFVISPWDDNEFDASNLAPGILVMDPSSTPQLPRFTKIPSDHVRSK